MDRFFWTHVIISLASLAIYIMDILIIFLDFLLVTSNDT